LPGLRRGSALPLQQQLVVELTAACLELEKNGEFG
jgi:hypothetical protein